MKNRRIFSGVVYTLLISILSIQPVLAFDEFFYSGNDIFHYNPDEICLTTNDTDVNLSGDGNLERILNYLVSQGMTLQGAAGAAGNIQVESAFNPKNVQNDYEDNEDNIDINGGGDAKAAPRLPNGDVDTSKMYKPIDDIGFGISQWTNGGTPEHPETGWIQGRPDRQTFLYQMAVDQKRDIADLGLQLDFLWSELEGNYKTSTLDKIKDITDVREAAKIYMINYEGPLDQSAAAQNGRADIAEAIYNRYKNRVTGETADTSDISRGNATGDPVPYKNPVFAGVAQGPTIIQDDDGTWHIYLNSGAGNPFKHLTSKDLVHWKQISRRTINTIGEGNKAWAPDVTKTGDHYTLVWTGGFGESESWIGYATSDNAGGPFTYKGKLLPSGNERSGVVLDPRIYVEGNKTYLSYGSGELFIHEVRTGSDGTIRAVGGRKSILKKGSGTGLYTIEQSWIEKVDDWYYLFYSAGDHRVTQGDGEYSIRVARSRNFTGPYSPRDHSRVVMQAKGDFRATGVNAITTDAAGNHWLIYTAVRGGDDRLMLDKLNFNDGWPVANNGYPSTERQQDGPVPGTGSPAAADEECASDGTGDVDTDESPEFGSITFPLKGNKSVVNNPEIFANGTTSNGHPYIAYDIYANAGVEVRAFADGVVTALHDGSLGKGASIHNEKSGLTIYYTHLNQLDVNEGQRVSAGEPVGTIASVNDYPGVNVDHLHIDASTDRIRGECSRSSCPIASHFREIGRELYQTYQKLPDGDE